MIANRIVVIHQVRYTKTTVKRPKNPPE